MPIHYFFHSLAPTELAVYYRLADMALVTPVKEGMILVSKEYGAARIKEDGVLILSAFAGSAEQLGRHALTVDPRDSESLAERIHQAYRIPSGERRRRMRALRGVVRRGDVFDWSDKFLQQRP